MEMVERYRTPTRILHWIHAAAFLSLIITGLFLYVPAFGSLAEGGTSRFIHRIAAVIFVAIPVLYFLTSMKASVKGIKEAFIWGKEDLGWLLAAPRYYFLGDESIMPPQDHMNTGQKMYWLIVLLSSVGFVITGTLMWFFKTALPGGVFMWSVFAHDVFFILILSMFFLHVYLSVIHPLMAGVFQSMVNGKVTAEYAKTHHAKWYERITKGEAK